MKLIFITGLYTKEMEAFLLKKFPSYIQNAPNVFQWAIIDGLVSNNIKFEVLSYPFLPCFPTNKFILTPKEDILYDKKNIGKVMNYSTIPILKQISISISIKKYISKLLKENKTEKIVVLTYSPLSYFVKPIIELKKTHKNLSLVSIVTDLIDDVHNFKENSTIPKQILNKLEYKAVKEAYNYIDKFILLTEQMTEKIPHSLNKNIVIEGIISDKSILHEKSEVDKDKKSIFYAGTLEEFSGVRELINAFKKINGENLLLIICGQGALATEIKEAALQDNRIIYLGVQPREEVLRLQKESTLLINPRRPDKSITRFSFPSKTMEYLVSGTPMLGYKLEGIPTEYYNYFYTINDLDEIALIDILSKVLSLPQKELNKKAKEAYDFIMKNKIAKIQVKRIIKFISENDYENSTN